MSGVSGIIATISPYVRAAVKRGEYKQMTAQDEKVLELEKKLLDCSGAQGSFKFRNVQVAEPVLSTNLTLADLKTGLVCGKDLVNQIVVTLNLQRNLDQFEPEIPVLERIQAVSDRILDKVNLFDLQLAGFAVPLRVSPVTLALIANDQLLCCETRDLGGQMSNLEVVAARVREVEESNPELFDRFRLQVFRPPWWFQSLHLSIGQLRVLSGKELNRISKRLPFWACRLLGENQVRSADFHRFDGKQLDAMILGDGSDEDVARRLGWLNPSQVEALIRKSSGCHFGKGTELFYQKLPLLRLNKDQLARLLGDEEGRANGGLRRRLQWLDPRQVSRGLHLLSEKHLTMLGDVQIAMLDFGALKSQQLAQVFLNEVLSQEEKKRRAWLIPERWVHQVFKVLPAIGHYLSAEQCQKIKTDQLFRGEVEGLFPALTIQSLFPGFDHMVELVNGEIRHRFESRGLPVFRVYVLSQQDLDAKMKERRAMYLETARKFTKDQVRTMFPLMTPDMQELLQRGS